MTTFTELRSSVSNLDSRVLSLESSIGLSALMHDDFAYVLPLNSTNFTKESGFSGTGPITAEIGGALGNAIGSYNGVTYNLPRVSALGFYILNSQDTTTGGAATNYFVRLRSNTRLNGIEGNWDLQTRVCIWKPYGNTYGTQSPSRFVFGLSVPSITADYAGQTADTGCWIEYDGSSSSNWKSKSRISATLDHNSTSVLPVVTNGTVDQLGINDSSWVELRISRRVTIGSDVVYFVVNGNVIGTTPYNPSIFGNELSCVLELFNTTGATSGRAPGVKDQNMVLVDYVRFSCERTIY